MKEFPGDANESNILLITIAVMLAGCSTYKELKPEPPLSSAEQGYVSLTDGEKDFQLKQSDKYFVKFPRPQQEYFYLVLTTPATAFTRSFFTDAFDDGEGTINKKKDQAGQDSVSVYAIDTTTQFSFWVIDSVLKDGLLPMTYRYVPQWRYTFETKFALYQKIWRTILSTGPFTTRSIPNTILTASIFLLRWKNFVRRTAG